MSDLLELVKNAPCGVVYGLDENPSGVEGPNIAAELVALVEAGDEAAQHEIPWKGNGWFAARAALAAKLEASR